MCAWGGGGGKGERGGGGELDGLRAVGGRQAGGKEGEVRGRVCGGGGRERDEDTHTHTSRCVMRKTRNTESARSLPPRLDLWFGRVANAAGLREPQCVPSMQRATTNTSITQPAALAKRVFCFAKSKGSSRPSVPSTLCPSNHQPPTTTYAHLVVQAQRVHRGLVQRGVKAGGGGHGAAALRAGWSDGPLGGRPVGWLVGW